MGAGIRSPLTFWGVSGYALDVNIIEASTTTVTITESQASIIIPSTILTIPDSLLITKYHSSIIVDTSVTTLTNLYTSMGNNVVGTVLQGSPVQNWTQRATVGMGNKLRGDFAPDYWTPTNPAFKALVPWEAATCWFVAWPGTGHTSTNTGINIKSIEVWIQRESTGEWRLENSGNLEIGWPPVGGGVTTRTEVDGSRSFFLSGNKNSGYVSGTQYAVHGSTPRFAVIDGDDIRCIYVRLEHRLILEDYTGPNDIEDSEIYVGIGADSWPTMSTVVGEYTPMTYAPQILSSRFELVTVESQYIQAATINPPAQGTGYPAGERSILRSSFELDLPPPLIPFASGIIDAIADSILITESQSSIITGNNIDAIPDSILITESQSSIITGNNIDAIADSILITESQSSIITGNNIDAIADSILITESQSSIITGNNIDAIADSILITESQSSIITGNNIDAIPDSILITESQSSIITGNNIDAIADSILITESQSSIITGNNIDAIADSILITESQSSIITGNNIDAIPDSILITESQSSIITGNNIDAIADSILITESQASVYLPTIIETTQDSIVISESQTVISSPVVINTDIQGILIQEQQATISIVGNINTIVESITITESQASVILGEVVEANIDSLIITESQASIYNPATINTQSDTIQVTGIQATYYIPDTLDSPQPLRVVLDQPGLKVIL